MRHINEGNLVLVVLDLNDIEGSFSPQFIEELIKKRANIHLVVNKIDTFPICSKLPQFKDRLIKFFNEMFPLISDLAS